MSQLLEKDQILSIVPQNFKNSNKGKILDLQEKTFSLEVFHEPEGIVPQNIMEFYSPTKNGMLYFTSSASAINGNKLTVLVPRKHRFLQRRSFTRVDFSQDMSLKSGLKTYKGVSINLSTGGMKLSTSDHLNIDDEYDISLTLINTNCIKCKFQPIKIEKDENGSYTLSGRFKNLTNADKMKIIQFCMRKSIEKANR